MSFVGGWLLAWLPSQRWATDCIIVILVSNEQQRHVILKAKTKTICHLGDSKSLAKKK